MPTQEKKFFSPILRTYGADTRKRWRVEYWTTSDHGKTSKRVVLYGSINKTKDIEERYRIAQELIAGISFAENQAPNIFEQVIKAYRLKWRPKTIQDYSTCVKYYLQWLGKKRAEHVSESQAQQFFIHLQDQGKSNTTIRKYSILLQRMYSLAVKENLCQFNPIKGLEKVKRSPRSLQYFSPSQISRFKEVAIPPQLWLCIQLCYYCYIRPGEMRKLKIGDVNFEYGFIEVSGDISKNKKTQRVIIPDQLLQEMKHLESYPNEWYLLGKSGIPGKDMIATNWINNEHRKILALLNIRGRYAFYSWKHTGVIMAVRAGINIRDIQTQLRHHSLEMVQEYLKQLGALDSDDIRGKFPGL